MSTISNPRELESAWNVQYTRLAQHFSRIIPKQGVVVEIGCGRGQLTIPLAEMVPKIQLTGVDSFTGPYAQNRTRLLSAPSPHGKKTKIRVIVRDYDAWVRSEPDSKYDAVISSEFLPELGGVTMRKFFVDCYRVIRPGGVTAHSFLSAKPRNARQKRLIEADRDPQWTKTPPAEWFSPTSTRVLEFLKKAGFMRPISIRLRSRLVIRSSAAREMLRDWDIRQTFWKSHRTELESDGLELPDWLIMGAKKLTS